MSENPNQPSSDPADASGATAEDGDRTPIVGTIADDKVIIVTPSGMGVAARDASSGSASGEGARDDTTDGDESRQRPTNPADLVEEPAKVMRIGSMIKQLLEEVRSAPLDDKGRARLAEIHDRSITELKDGLAPELVAELDRIALPFRDEDPSDAELRIAQAQLVGWLEGLFHGIQTALVAQQMAAQAQLQQMRALPPGHPGAEGGHGIPGMPRGPAAPAPDTSPKSPNGGTGQYL